MALTAKGIAEATERLYRSLFSAAVGFAFLTAIWGAAIAPFNDFHAHTRLSLALGAPAIAAAVALWVNRDQAFLVFRRHGALLLVVALLGVAILWVDGGWRSSYYLLSYTSIGLAAVSGGVRWSLLCACVLATGYVETVRRTV